MTTTTAAALRRDDTFTLHGKPATMTRHAVTLTGAVDLGKARLYIEREDGKREKHDVPVARVFVTKD